LLRTRDFLPVVSTFPFHYLSSPRPLASSHYFFSAPLPPPCFCALRLPPAVFLFPFSLVAEVRFFPLLSMILFPRVFHFLLSGLSVLAVSVFVFFPTTPPTPLSAMIYSPLFPKDWSLSFLPFPPLLLRTACNGPRKGVRPLTPRCTDPILTFVSVSLHNAAMCSILLVYFVHSLRLPVFSHSFPLTPCPPLTTPTFSLLLNAPQGFSSVPTPGVIFTVSLITPHFPIALSMMFCHPPPPSLRPVSPEWDPEFPISVISPRLHAFGSFSLRCALYLSILFIVFFDGVFSLVALSSLFPQKVSFSIVCGWC